jgi:YjjG family noncanonical pyrimidine nucleotidase
MHYQWLVFDADNTLLDFNRSTRIAFFETIQAIGLLPSDAHFDIYHRINLACWTDLEAGRITPDELKLLRFSRFLEYLDLNQADPAEMNTRYFEVLIRSTFLVDGALEILKALSAQGYPMAVATNGLAEVQRHRLAEARLDHFFRDIFVSEEIGYFKPHPGFFRVASSRLQIRPDDRVLMIGDSLHSDIEGARSAGWDTCWFNPDQAPAPEPESPDFVIQRLDQLLEILR